MNLMNLKYLIESKKKTKTKDCLNLMKEVFQHIFVTSIFAIIVKKALRDNEMHISAFLLPNSEGFG